MNGSMLVVDLPNRAAVDAWLARDPYVTEKYGSGSKSSHSALPCSRS